MPAKKRFIRDYRVLRAKLRLSQAAFWSRIGVTQTTGSRYESGKWVVPTPVATLAHSVYVDGNPVDARDFK